MSPASHFALFWLITCSFCTSSGRSAPNPGTQKEPSRTVQRSKQAQPGFFHHQAVVHQSHQALQLQYNTKHSKYGREDATKMSSSNSNESKEMWPTLNQAHGSTNNAETTENEAEWEFVCQDDDRDKAIEIQVVPPAMRKLRHCSSSPDLRFIGRALESVSEDDHDEDITIDSIDSSAVLVSKKLTSFRDAILAQSADSPDEKKQEETSKNFPTHQKKIKPKLVVMPIKRCSRSTGDLQSLVIHENEVLGESDAMDYYYRKSVGAANRVNGLKMRPDEAKRKSMILNKKKAQQRQTA